MVRGKGKWRKINGAHENAHLLELQSAYIQAFKVPKGGCFREV